MHSDPMTAAEATNALKTPCPCPWCRRACETVVALEAQLIAGANGGNALFEKLSKDFSDLAAELEHSHEHRFKLLKFKHWVHAYLDRHSVPHHPPGPHGAEGCRIGDRMDWLIAERDRLAAENVALRKKLARVIEDGIIFDPRNSWEPGDPPIVTEDV